MDELSGGGTGIEVKGFDCRLGLVHGENGDARCGAGVLADNPTQATDADDYVRWAYRLLLGRKPESHEAIRNNAFKNDRQRLVQYVLVSAEFERPNPILLFPMVHS
jgi:hypothetical protein